MHTQHAARSDDMRIPSLLKSPRALREPTSGQISLGDDYSPVFSPVNYRSSFARFRTLVVRTRRNVSSNRNHRACMVVTIVDENTYISDTYAEKNLFKSHVGRYTFEKLADGGV